jgi:hypothetical protein
MTRHITNRRAQQQRTRRELKRRAHLPESCPRCHRERAIDTHELVRRSQWTGAATDLEVMVNVGRECHDWIGAHPDAAHAEGWALWRWELADMAARHEAGLRRLAVELGLPAVAYLNLDTSRENLLDADSLHDMPRATAQAILDPDVIGEIDRLADAEDRTRSAMIRILVREALSARSARDLLERRTAEATPPSSRGVNPVTGRAYGPVPKG